MNYQQAVLSQAWELGCLRGDEYRTVAEQNPQLIAALAKRLDVGNEEEVRRIAYKGELTIRMVFDAMTDIVAQPRKSWWQRLRLRKQQ